LNILAVDDHPIFQQGLARALLDDFPDVKVTLVASARDALLRFPEEKWDLVILDLSLPDKSGLDLLKEMKHLRPEIPLLVLTLHSEDRFAIRSFRAGADGYLNKQSSPQYLAEAIRKILGGGKYVTSGVAEKLALQLGKSTSVAPHELLSDREFQVLGLLAQGRSVGAIAENLNLSVNTISTYRTRILEKLELKNTAELVAYAMRNNLIE
jgi:two-component system, NarL family, invasion response regulator UvrY